MQKNLIILLLLFVVTACGPKDNTSQSKEEESVQKNNYGLILAHDKNASGIYDFYQHHGINDSLVFFSITNCIEEEDIFILKIENYIEENLVCHELFYTYLPEQPGKYNITINNNITMILIIADINE